MDNLQNDQLPANHQDIDNIPSEELENSEQEDLGGIEEGAKSELPMSDTKAEPEYEYQEIGIFKLKDKKDREGVRLEPRLFGYMNEKKEFIHRPTEELNAIYIVKIRGESSKIKIVLEWLKKDSKPAEIDKNS